MDWGDIAKLVSTYVGGFGTRWGYDRFIVSPKDKKKERERKQQLRALLKDNFERNLSLLQEIERDMKGDTIDGTKQVHTYNADLPILESTSGLMQFDVLEDVNVYKPVDNARCELTHLARKINWLADMNLKRPRDLPGPTTPLSINAAENVFYDLARSTLSLVQTCQAACRNAIKALDRYETDNQRK
jgi:hypothetical protein